MLLGFLPVKAESLGDSCLKQDHGQQRKHRLHMREVFNSTPGSHGSKNTLGWPWGVSVHHTAGAKQLMVRPTIKSGLSTHLPPDSLSVVPRIKFLEKGP